MKKTITVILLSSAILIPNHHADAAYTSETVEVESIQSMDWKDMQSTSTKLNQYKGYTFYQKWFTFGNKYFHQGKPKPNKPNHEETKPEQPEVAPTPKPEQKPEQEVTPEVDQKPSTPETPSVPAPETPEVKPDDSVDQEQPSASISAVEQEILKLTNAERQKAGLAPLAIDENLMKSARAKSKDMAQNRYFSHTSPTYGSPFDQMATFGVKYRSAAENIAYGQRSAEEVVRAWMDSPGHRQNILTGNFTHIGIGYDANGHYWTQQFIGK